MKRIYIPSTGMADWREGLADPDKQWVPGYSAFETATAWADADGLPAEVAALLPASAELLFAIPEHKVALPGGTRESQCDVFALIGTDEGLIAAAIEGKVNEAFGPLIGEWMVSASEGKRIRLNAICNLLGTAYPPAPELRYQLFHRTAAAILEAKRFRTRHAAMIVHSFSPDKRWFEDYAAFCRLLGTSARADRPVTITLPGDMMLTLGWASGRNSQSS